MMFTGALFLLGSFFDMSVLENYLFHLYVKVTSDSCLIPLPPLFAPGKDYFLSFSCLPSQLSVAELEVQVGVQTRGGK